MPFLIDRSKKSPIGLDVGAWGVRAAQLTRSGLPRSARSNAAIHTIAAVAVSDAGASSLDRDSSLPEARVAESIQRCLGLANFQGKRTCALLNSPAVEFHPLELPPAILAGERAANGPDASSLDQVIQWEVSRLLEEPGDAESAIGTEVETRHWLLPNTHVAAPNVLGVAVSRPAVDRVLGICSAARLDCVRVDAGAAVAARFGAVLNDWGEDHLWGVLDLACDDARLVLCVDDVPVLVRRIGSGGRGWTRRIAESLRVSLSSAEVHKCEHGLRSTGRRNRRHSDEEAMPANGASRSEVAAIVSAALRSELKEMTSQVKRSYEYALSCYPKRRAADLVLVGGGAKMGNLPEYLENALGIPVRRASDYLGTASCRLAFADECETDLECLAFAIGAALDD